MIRQELTRAAVLRLNDRWDAADVRMIEALLDGRPEVLPYKDEVEHRRPELDAFVRTLPALCANLGASGEKQVDGFSADGRRLLRIRPGAVDLYPGGQELTVLHLSTVGHSTRGTRRPEIPDRVCPGCNLALPASGSCDDCDA